MHNEFQARFVQLFSGNARPACSPISDGNLGPHLFYTPALGFVGEAVVVAMVGQHAERKDVVQAERGA